MEQKTSYSATFDAGFMPAAGTVSYTARPASLPTEQADEAVADKAATPIANQLNIKGIPVWKLNGVTKGNLDIVLKTQLWVKEPRSGTHEYCICVPEALHRAVFSVLGKAGISKGEAVCDKKGERIMSAWAVGITIMLASILAGGAGVAIGLFACAILCPLIARADYKSGEIIKPLLENKKSKWDEESSSMFCDNHSSAFSDDDPWYLDPMYRHMTGNVYN